MARVGEVEFHPEAVAEFDAALDCIEKIANKRRWISYARSTTLCWRSLQIL
jgi:hypothetical protein